MEDPAWIATGVSLFDYLDEQIDDEHEGRWHQIVAITIINYYGLLLLCVETERTIRVQAALEGYTSFLSLQWRCSTADGPGLVLATDPEDEMDWAWVPPEAIEIESADGASTDADGAGYEGAAEESLPCLSSFDLRALVLPHITSVADLSHMVVFPKH